MSVYLYPGGFRLIRKSGVGQAILHQRKALAATGIPLAQTMAEGDIVHINTVFPDSLLVALAARLSGKKVVYYAHSTMEDFRRSFPGPTGLPRCSNGGSSGAIRWEMSLSLPPTTPGTSLWDTASGNRFTA